MMTWVTSTHINDDDGNAVNNNINDNDDTSTHIMPPAIMSCAVDVINRGLQAILIFDCKQRCLRGETFLVVVKLFYENFPENLMFLLLLLRQVGVVIKVNIWTTL